MQAPRHMTDAVYSYDTAAAAGQCPGGAVIQQLE